MTELPHFSQPFRFQAQAAVTEQDSIDEIADCALTIMLCPLGFRVELPEFGVPDPTFSSPVVDTDTMRTLIERWEPRASVRFAQHPDELDELITTVQTLVQVRTQE